MSPPTSSGPPWKLPPQKRQAERRQRARYPYVFRQRVLRVDIPRLTREFSDPVRFAQVQQRLAEAIGLIRCDPECGKALKGSLSG